MFESEHEGRHWRFYIQDMIEFSEKVLSYTDGLDQDAFVADERTYDAAYVVCTSRKLLTTNEGITYTDQWSSTL